MTDPAFVGAGKKPGLELWRIEKMAPVKLTEVNGHFYTGDAYILLSTKQKDPRSALEWSLHFWLGSESSQDERGVAAYKTVELDDALGGGAVQYREIEGNESSLFLSYFKAMGIQYLPGGVASGFTKVERDVYRTRLLQVKGSRVVRAREVPLASASLNTNDVFILDAGLKLFLYNGSGANRGEKAKGVELLYRIRDSERGGRAEVIIVNEDPHNAEFWGHLGGEVEVTNAGEPDDKAEAKQQQPVLSRISDASGSIEITKIDLPDGKLHRESLDAKDVFVVDSGDVVYVWIGKEATATERREALGLAASYLKAQGRSPDDTQITRVVQGAENAVFKSLFKQWDPPLRLDFGFQGSKGVAVTPRTAATVDVAGLLKQVRADEATVDDGSGKVQVWRIENLNKTEVPQESYGHFYSGDCYLVLYTYSAKGGGKPQYVIYYWQGLASTTDEKATSALLAVEMDKELGGTPVQVRVVQGKEPAHFRQIFKGRMVVHSGGVASGFKNRNEEEETTGLPSLYHVKGTSPLNTYAVQVQPAAATSLNSGDCFVLTTKDAVFAWLGNASNEAEKETAVATAESLKGAGRSVVSAINEGSEPDEFWEALGGKAEYPSTKVGAELPKEPRLFHLSNATGTVKVEEVYDYAQTDLVDDDVMLLDTFTSVFIWVGSHANDEEKAQALKIAQEYIDAAADGRDSSTPIVKVTSGNEPDLFTQHFLAWDADLASRNVFTDPYEAKLAKLREEAAKAPPKPAYTLPPASPRGPSTGAAAPKPAPPLRSSSSSSSSSATPPPPPVPPTPASSTVSDDGDPTRREAALSDDEFEKTFNMTKAEFYALPKWKQVKLKKDTGLF